MNEISIIRGLIGCAHQRFAAGSQQAKSVLEWVREQGGDLFVLPRSEIRRLSWRALGVNLVAEPPRYETHSQQLALAAELSSLLGLDDAQKRTAAVFAAFLRLPRVVELVEKLVDLGIPATQLAGQVSGQASVDADHWVRSHPLVRFGLVRIKANWRGAIQFEPSPALRRLFNVGPHDSEGILAVMVGENRPASLSQADFGHVADFDFLARLLGGAVRDGVGGINILVHGPPGTGKTELARAVAASAGVALYSVCEDEVDGWEPDRSDRVVALRTGYQLLRNCRGGALLFDEMEDLIGDGRPGEGDWQVGREGSKVFVNRLFEHNPVPVIWTSNAIGNIDAAILRRMSFVLHLDYPRRSVALTMSERIGSEEGMPVSDRLRRFVGSAKEASTVMRVASRAARLAGDSDALRPAESIVRTLRGGGVPHGVMGDVDLDLYCSATPIAPLFERLRDSGCAEISLLMTGPPGTGKTALAHHFARLLDRPLIVKRASDLLSKWVGETEQRIAGAFAEAREEGGVLFFDEVDSMLFDRGAAQTTWEVGQVNEMLTWLEGHPFPVIAATNASQRLDRATLRRFDSKLALEVLDREAADRAWRRFFGSEPPSVLAGLRELTPGDFAVVARQVRNEGALGEADLLARLAGEVQARGQGPGRMGFALG